MRRRAAALALVTLASTPALYAAGPRFWRLEGARAFLEGDVEGVSIDSDGRLRLGTASRVLLEPELPNAWSLARDDRGVLYVGTGNDGRVLRVEAGQSTVVLDADELEVHAVAIGPDGRVYAATSPDGAVYAIDGSSTATRFFDPPEKYIWALACDRQGAVYVATGAEGRVYRVSPEGRSEVMLSTAETHVLSLALDGRGRVFAGSAPEGIVYRIDAPGRAFVLLDSDFREIKALDVGDDGGLYVAAIDGQTAETPRRPAATPSPPSATGSGDVVAEVTVTESYSIAPQAAAAAPTGAETPPSGPPKGALLRIRVSGEVDTLWSSTEDIPHSVVRLGASALVGTGDKGKVYRVGDDGRWALVARLPAQHVTALLRTSTEAAVAVTSNPARLVALDGALAAEGHFVSKPRDAEAMSTWGRLSWDGSSPKGTGVRLDARGGNTATPDDTWTDWRPATPDRPSPLSERVRFLQLRLTLSGDGGTTPTVEAVSAPYLQANLPPVVKSITVHPPGEVFQRPITVSGEPEILGLPDDPTSERAAAQRPPAGSPPAVSFSRKLQQPGLRTFSWQAEDPNGDTLVFGVEYRAVGDEHWRRLRADLAEPVFAWDTANVPNGRYVLRVVASDHAGNPPALALEGHRDSVSFEVDNTAPTVSASIDPSRPDVVRATVRDDASPVRRLEMSIDAGRWEEIYPSDGMADSLEETYEIVLPPARGGVPRIVVLRASDLLGNVATARVDAP